MTYMSGHHRRRYRFTKRTHHNQELGPFIAHEMNRCIACYRCVRFYQDYAGGDDLGVYASNNRVYFGRPEDGQFDSEFSGNLTEVCPTGCLRIKPILSVTIVNGTCNMPQAFAMAVRQAVTFQQVSVMASFGVLKTAIITMSMAAFMRPWAFGYGYVNRADRPTHPLKR